MTNINFNSKIIQYNKINNIDEDETKEKLEQENTEEKQENEIEAGSRGVELGEENMKLLEQTGLLSKYQASAKTEKFEVEGLPEGFEITVDKSKAGANITCQYDHDTKTLTISGKNCVVNLNGKAKLYDINVNLSGKNMTLNSNTTVTSINNSGLKSVIKGSDGNDNITSSGIKATIYGGNGDDTITTDGIKTIIHGGKGNDTITADGINTQIYADDDNDIIEASGININAEGGAGSDIINASGTDIILNGSTNEVTDKNTTNTDTNTISGEGINIKAIGGKDTNESNNITLKGIKVTVDESTISENDSITLNDKAELPKTDSELQQESLQAFKDANSKLDLEDATFTYDKNNKVISYAKDGVTVSISYDSDGNLLNGKNSDGKLCQNGLLFSGYNTKDGVMYSAGEVLNGLGENGLMYENGLLCDNSITTTTDNETIVSTYEMGKLVSKSVDKFDANGAKVQNTSETYDKYDRITEKVVTYYENGEISHSVSTSDYVYPDNYTSTPTSYAEVNPDGTFTVSNLTLDKNGDIVSCTKTDENDVAKFYTLQDGELQPANGTIDGVTYVDGVAQTDTPSTEQLEFINNLLKKLGITLQDGESISDITNGLEKKSDTISDLDIALLSNANTTQIAYFKIGNDTYILNYDDKGNVSSVNKTDNPEIKVIVGGGSENFENWEINANGKITEHIKGWQENHGTSFRHSIVTTTYTYDEQDNLTSSIKTEDNLQSAGFLIDENNIENKHTITAYDKNNNQIYTINDKILPYDDDNFPKITDTTSSSATITFEGGKTLEIKQGDSVVINEDKTVTVTNNDITKTYNADGTEKVENEEIEPTPDELKSESLNAFKQAHSEMDFTNATFTYDDNNKVVSYTINGKTTNISYDNEGNLLNGTNSDKKFCQNGLPFSGVNSADGLLYADGTKFNGVNTSDNKLYKNGAVDTATQIYENVLYENGTKSTGTKVFNNTLYENGVKSTGTKVFNDTLYENGTKSTETKVYNNTTLYVNGELPTENTTFNGKLYMANTGKVANGTIDGVEYKDGVKVENEETEPTPDELKSESLNAFKQAHSEMDFTNATFTYNDNNRVVSYTINGKTTNIYYDNEGNLLNGTNSDKKLCQNGLPFSGVNSADGLLYADGTKFNGVNTSDNKLYKNGAVDTATQIYENVLYENGVKSTGTKVFNDTLYENGTKSTGTKVFNDTLYENGTKSTGTKVFNNTLYENGTKSTGTKVFNDTLYENGTKSTGTKLYNNTTLYVNGELPTENTTFNGKLYMANTGEVANGTIDGVEYKDGVKVENPVFENTDIENIYNLLENSKSLWQDKSDLLKDIDLTTVSNIKKTDNTLSCSLSDNRNIIITYKNDNSTMFQVGKDNNYAILNFNFNNILTDIMEETNNNNITTYNYYSYNANGKLICEGTAQDNNSNNYIITTFDYSYDKEGNLQSTYKETSSETYVIKNGEKTIIKQEKNYDYDNDNITDAKETTTYKSDSSYANTVVTEYDSDDNGTIDKKFTKTTTYQKVNGDEIITEDYAIDLNNDNIIDSTFTSTYGGNEEIYTYDSNNDNKADAVYTAKLSYDSINDTYNVNNGAYTTSSYTVDFENYNTSENGLIIRETSDDGTITITDNGNVYIQTPIEKEYYWEDKTHSYSMTIDGITLSDEFLSEHVSNELLTALFSDIENTRLTERLQQDLLLVYNAEQTALKAGEKGSEAYQTSYNNTIKSALIKTYDANTTYSAGDVIEKSDGSLYTYNGTELIELDISADTYLKLFPPIERYDISQNDNIGDCYFITGGLIDTFKNPIAFAQLLQVFSEDENGNLTVTFPGTFKDSMYLSDYPVTFENSDGELELKTGTTGTLNGALGMQILEQAFALSRFACETASEITNLDIDEAIEYINSGWESCTYQALLGTEAELLTFDISEIDNFASLLNNGTVLLSAGTSDNDQYDPYNIYGSHAYSIESIDTENQIIQITNPWYAGMTIDVPYVLFCTYFETISVTYLDDLQNTENETTEPAPDELKSESLNAFKQTNSEMDFTNATFTYDDNNRVASYTINGKTTNISYDNEGNLLNGTNSDKKLCQNGLPFIGVNSADGLLYADGTKFNGVNTSDNKLYKNGAVDTATQIYENVLYENGVKSTGTKVFNDTLYENGTKSTGTKLYNNTTLYVNGELPTENTTFNGKLYMANTGEVANGTIDGVEYKDGVKVEPPETNGITKTYSDKGELLVNNQLATGLVENVVYKDGFKAEGVVDGIMYHEGLPFSGIVTNNTLHNLPNINSEETITINDENARVATKSEMTNYLNDTNYKCYINGFVYDSTAQISETDFTIANNFTGVTVDENGNDIYYREGYAFSGVVGDKQYRYGWEVVTTESTAQNGNTIKTQTINGKKTTEFEYQNGKLISERSYSGTNTYSEEAYTYNDAGLVSKVVCTGINGIESYTDVYTYNDLNQVIEINRTSPNGSTSNIKTEYGENGLPIKQTATEKTYNYDKKTYETTTSISTFEYALLGDKYVVSTLNILNDDTKSTLQYTSDNNNIVSEMSGSTEDVGAWSYTMVHGTNTNATDLYFNDNITLEYSAGYDSGNLYLDHVFPYAAPYTSWTFLQTTYSSTLQNLYSKYNEYGATIKAYYSTEETSNTAQFFYDEQGRVSKETWTIEGTIFESSFEYSSTNLSKVTTTSSGNILFVTTYNE